MHNDNNTQGENLNKKHPLFRNLSKKITFPVIITCGLTSIILALIISGFLPFKELYKNQSAEKTAIETQGRDITKVFIVSKPSDITVELDPSCKAVSNKTPVTCEIADLKESETKTLTFKAANEATINNTKYKFGAWEGCSKTSEDASICTVRVVNKKDVTIEAIYGTEAVSVPTPVNPTPTPGNPSPPPSAPPTSQNVRITDVKFFFGTASSESCPFSRTAEADITVEGSGTLTYYLSYTFVWAQETVNFPQKTITFTGNGTKTVRETLQFPIDSNEKVGSNAVPVTLHIVSPYDRTYMDYTYGWCR